MELYYLSRTIIYTILAGLAVSLLSRFIQIFIGRITRRSSAKEDRIQILIKSLQDASTIIGGIEGEILARQKMAEELKKKVDHYNAITALKANEVDAVTQLVRGELSKQSKKSLWQGIAINFIFFILGAAASIIITMLSQTRHLPSSP